MQVRNIMIRTGEWDECFFFARACGDCFSVARLNKTYRSCFGVVGME
jgi:hypothetical protein